MTRRAVDAAEAGEGGGIEAGEAGPLVAGLGRAHGLGNEAPPRRRRGEVEARRRPGRDRAARHAQRCQELPEPELRVARAEGGPALVVQLRVEAGQHQRALGQARHHRQQLRRRRNAAGAAGGDHRVARWPGGPGARLPGEQPVAPLRRVEGALLGQDLRPLFGDDGEELQGELPVPREFVRHQGGELCEGQALDLDLIDEPRECRRQTHRLVGADRVPGPLLYLPRQQHAPAQGRDRRRHLGLGVRLGPGAGGLEQGQLVLVDIAHRQEPRQGQGPAPGPAQEGVAQGTAGAAVRQQYKGPGQRQRLVRGAPSVDQPGGQGVDERQTRFNVVDRGRCGHGIR